MADKQPGEPQTPVSPQRIRYLPDWEVPLNPPKRSLFSHAKISRSLQRSRLVTALRPKPTPAGAGATTRPTSHESFQKDAIIGTGDGPGSILPLTRTSTLHTISPAPNSPTRRPGIRSRFDAALPPHRRYLCGLTRRTVLLVAAVTFVLLALGLGLGLGLGLRNRSRKAADLPLPDRGPRVYQGDLTYFSPALGACGWTSGEADAVCAVGHELFDAAGASVASGGNPNANPLCGRMIRVTREFSEAGVGARNVSVDVKVVDRCTGCHPTDLDLAPGVFRELASEARGRVVGQWEWL